MSTNTDKFQILLLRKKLKAAQHKRKERLNIIAELGKLLAGYRTIGNVTKIREYTAILSLERHLLKGENEMILDLNKQLKKP
jgi:hypothetical protein